MKKTGIISVFVLALSLNAAVVSAQNMNSGSMPMMNSSAKAGTTQSQMPNNNSMMGMMNMMQGGMMGRGMMNGGMMGMMRGYMQNMMNTPMRRMMMSVYILPSLDTLGLSSSQKSELGTLKSDYLKKQQDISNKMAGLQSKLSGQLGTESLNMKNIHKLITKKAGLQGNWQWTSIDTYHNMMGVLTKDQQKQFKSMNAQSLMTAMMNNVPMSKMMAFCQSMRSNGQGMMNGMMGRGMMYGSGGMVNQSPR